MNDFLFYSRKLILKNIEDKKDSINYVECFIKGYFEDTSCIIYNNGEYTLDVNSKRFKMSNTLNIQGLNGSYKAEPSMRIHFKDGSEHELPCYEKKEQIDVTNELSEVIKNLKNNGVLKLEVKANRDIVSELQDILKMVSVTK